MTQGKKLQFTGRLQVIEMAGTWGVYAGERIVCGSGESFRDDLGVRIREVFEAGAKEVLDEGRSPSERFELASVRVTVELVDPPPSPAPRTAPSLTDDSP